MAARDKKTMHAEEIKMRRNEIAYEDNEVDLNKKFS